MTLTHTGRINQRIKTVERNSLHRYPKTRHQRGKRPSHSATGISTGPDLQPPEDSTHLESPVRTSDGSDSDHLVPTNSNKTPKGATAGGLTLEKRTDKGVKTGGKVRGEVVGTPTHQGLTKPTDKTNTKTTNPIVQPQQAGGTKSPVPEGEKEKPKQVVRKNLQDAGRLRSADPDALVSGQT